MFAALALAASALAQGGTSARVTGSKGILLEHGIGSAVIADRGAAFGKVASGSIRIVNLPGGGAPSGWVRGCETRSGRLAGRLVCRGSGLRFFIHGGTWRIRLRGRGINVSGVIRGSLGLDRRGACSRCTFQIGDSAKRRWPATLTFYAVRS
jgi:hypothetical protein